ncbi:hypothetical protein NP233_g8962 [Leucocoprinus birnbaumii]|uniref:mannan endo-1,4-beta-mannosidase n=1 Tax=Leucocoprinus birnbaumii TaxID=56174 RepID=A0AAD5YT85_9AGAR|nr:hypothetical protein NP233_g8962 [Leucocoprinus birnbaumii]
MLVLSQGLVLLALLTLDGFAKSVTKTTTAPKRQTDVAKNNFVRQEGSQLMVNGSEFRYIGTTAYWLSSLNSEADIDATLKNIAQAGFNVVRTWAFNDVDSVPENGTWFQTFQNGTFTINRGANGLQKLDKVVELARNHGIYILPSLTNNWNPRLSDKLNVTDPISVFRMGRRDIGTGNDLPRNTLSNDYGGMDFYVRALGGPREHDQFFTNRTLIEAFQNYTREIVTRYANHPNVLAWELANDPRCGSSIAASAGCVPQNITRWHAEMAQFIRTIDSNHVVATGHQGFFCTGCPKLFPIQPQPRPRPSPAPGARRTTAEPLTRKRLLLERKEAFKKTRAAAARTEGGIRIRGRWLSTPTRRQQDPVVGSSFDGSQGVDSEDIMNIPGIGLSSFMFLPDQNSYGPDDPNLSRLDNILQQGLTWIRLQAEASQTFGKPTAISAMGLVDQANAQSFVPFNSTIAPFATDTSVPGSPSVVPRQLPAPSSVSSLPNTDMVSNTLTQLTAAGVQGGLAGMVQYQWSQSNLTTQPGTPIVPANGTIPATGSTTGNSPNDGYALPPVSLAGMVNAAGGGFQQP